MGGRRRADVLVRRVWLAKVMPACRRPPKFQRRYKMPFMLAASVALVHPARQVIGYTRLAGWQQCHQQKR